MEKKELRSGITTGTCAAAAAQAAVLAYLGENPAEVTVVLPDETTLSVTIAAWQKTAAGGKAVVRKDSGDDPDITNGVEIQADVTIEKNGDIVIQGGEGVGKVTKPGLAMSVGESAINPTPRKMIRAAVKRVLPPGYGAAVTISIPGGEALAARTLNPAMGVIGGLSILGTSGIVHPMSEEAFKNSLTPQISVVKALGYSAIVFAPGKIGQDIAVNHCQLPADAVVQTSNFIGHMLEAAAEYQMKQVLLFGHLGKLCKVAAGIFHTHNRMADGRLESIAAYAASIGASQKAVQEILACTTTEAVLPIISDHSLEKVYPLLAARASFRAERYVFGDLKVGTVLVTLQGKILGLDETAKEIGGSLGWNIK
ncbi:MAG: cobalt-precorrin-5B (C(1))-methyltransferase CbiD [Pelosinus sp.]|nr:cobalt-precorrin-5B (C(1))-methyltransferase CbiD [Pelosinus sp.]